MTTNDKLFSLFRPLSPIYSTIMKSREKLYERESLKSNKFDVPVISVGNLTMGGTGKTPLVMFLANHFRKKSFKPSIISRGYKGKAEKPINVVSDYQNVYLNAEYAGDEPYLLAKSLPGVPVLTGKKRILPCEEAISAYGSDLVILDDGFQHLPVRRDIDLVLFNSSSLSKKMYVLPGGDLREPLVALKRCSSLVFTNYQDKYESDLLTFLDKLSEIGINKPVFKLSLGEVSLLQHSEDNAPIQIYNPKDNFFVFSGIGNPDRLKSYLLEKDLKIAGFSTFGDHHNYNQNDIDQIIENAELTRSTALLTTEKDYVKVKDLKFPLPLFTAKPELLVCNELITFLNKHINNFFEDTATLC